MKTRCIYNADEDALDVSIMQRKDITVFYIRDKALPCLFRHDYILITFSLTFLHLFLKLPNFNTPYSFLIFL